MREGEIEYEFDEGVICRNGEPREDMVKEVSSRLALLRKTHGSAAVAEALRRAMVTAGTAES